MEVLISIACHCPLSFIAHPRNAVARIAEFIADKGVLESFVFEGWDLDGPAVLVHPQGTTFANTTSVEAPYALLWEVPLDRTEVVGAVLVRNGTCEGCTL